MMMMMKLMMIINLSLLLPYNTDETVEVYEKVNLNLGW